MCVEGGAGTGKSVCLRRVRSALQEQGLQVACASLTHSAARNVDGVTCHPFAQKYVNNGVFPGHVVLIDEISFLSIDLLAQLEQLRLKGVRLLCFGDFKQLPPVSNRWRGQLVPPCVFEKSGLFYRWSDGVRFVLRRCRRSDQEHYDNYTRLRELPMDECLSEAQRLYPPPPADNSATWHICLSNHKRRRLNEECQRRLAEQIPASEKILVESDEAHYEVFVGTRLMGCNSTLRPILNCSFPEVSRLGEDRKSAFLRDVERPELAEFEVSLLNLAKHTKLRHALTVPSVQGRSLSGTITVHDVANVNFRQDHMYVGLSRSTDARDVSVERT